MTLTETEVLKRLYLFILDHHGSQKDFAKAVSASQPYVCEVLKGRKAVPAKWLSLIGVCRLVEVSYVESVRP